VIASNPETVSNAEIGLETEPVFYRGAPCRAAKSHAESTHRACPPAETLQRILPVLSIAGITRLADVTGLDRIGIPTILAMRPNAPTLSNSSGKGFSTVDAKVSAAMEGIELFCAEEEDRFSFDVVKATYDELDRSGMVPPVGLLPFSRYSLFHRSVPEEWVFGWDLIGQREVAVPFEVVSMTPGHVRVRPHVSFSFQVGSNGLASGNVFLEAVCSGLAEVIERDAVTCAKIRTGHDISRLPRVDLGSIRFERVRSLLERLRSKGILPIIVDCTGDTEVPVFEAYLVDDEVPSTGTYCGYGAHLHPEVAMVRALTEAVQSRAVYIAGSRDDMFTLEHLRMRSRPSEHLIKLARSEGSVDVSAVQSRATGSFEGDCHALLEGIRRVGLPSVVVVDLSWPELGVSVVRVVVPGLEGYSVFPYYAPGPRATSAGMKAQAEA
jgi:ribosomal protein S12 methylthiotransferase accessory factor